MLRNYFAFFIHSKSHNGKYELSDAGNSTLYKVIENFYKDLSSSSLLSSFRCMNGDSPYVIELNNSSAYYAYCDEDSNPIDFSIDERDKELILSGPICNLYSSDCLEKAALLQLNPIRQAFLTEETRAHCSGGSLLVDGWQVNDVNGLCANSSNSIVDNLGVVGIIGIAGIAGMLLWCLTCVICRLCESSNKKTVSNSTLLENDANAEELESFSYRR